MKVKLPGVCAAETELQKRAVYLRVQEEEEAEIMSENPLFAHAFQDVRSELCFSPQVAFHLHSSFRCFRSCSLSFVYF